MVHMRILDLWCGAGGASKGYLDAPFEGEHVTVLGVDPNPQKRYPYPFEQADPLEYALAHGHMFDAIHVHLDSKDAIPHVRNMLLAIGKPYIIERDKADGLLNPVLLCGDMFALGCYFEGEFLRLRRHRFFETTFECEQMKHFTHVGNSVSVVGRPGGSSKRDGRKFPSTPGWKEAMGIDWMVAGELAKAIPPVYTQFIGEELLKSLRV